MVYADAYERAVVLWGSGRADGWGRLIGKGVDVRAREMARAWETDGGGEMHTMKKVPSESLEICVSYGHVLYIPMFSGQQPAAPNSRFLKNTEISQRWPDLPDLPDRLATV